MSGSTSNFLEPATDLTELSSSSEALVYAPPAGPSQANEISFISGIDSSGAAVATAFATWAGNSPDTGGSSTSTIYNTTSSAQKWGSTTAGTPGGTLYYYFTPASNWTTTEQGVFQTSFALWSAEANINFVATTNAAQSTVTITRGSDGNAYESSMGAFSAAIGSTTLGQTTSALISIDTSVPGFGPITSVTGGSGYPAGTLVHEIGHLLNLGHDGPYDGNANPATQQYSAYDTKLWSIMSYILPTDTTAKYINSYPVAGTDWGAIQTPETPMPDDILAAQQLYGAPTSTPLSGGQVFGFNSNITGALANYFNFSLNSAPVLTLYDQGTGNALDLSGYATSSTVNLNAGTFSSVNGLTNNLGIAYNTAINTVVGGSGDDAFTINTAPDSINGGAGANTVVFAGNRANYALSTSGGNILATNTTTLVTDTLTNIQTLQFADMAVQASSIACYAAGTRVTTPSGEVAVERLSIGDLLVTAGGPARPIRWIGQRRYSGRFAARNPAVLPIRIRAGALAGGVPRRDLFVSPEHAMFVEDVLVPARLLLNGTSVVQVSDVTSVAYFHLELDSHDVILAEGAASETFIDDGSRGVFHNAGAFRTLYPDAPRQAARYCAPRVEDGALLESIRARIGARAEPVAVNRLEGHVDEVSRSLVRGWARDPAAPDRRVALQVWNNGVVIGCVRADGLRPDLVQAGIGDGCHGFLFEIPAGLAPGWAHAIEVRDASGVCLSPLPWLFVAAA